MIGAILLMPLIVAEKAGRVATNGSSNYQPRCGNGLPLGRVVRLIYQSTGRNNHLFLGLDQAFCCPRRTLIVTGKKWRDHGKVII